MTSQTNISLIERYIFGKLSPVDRLLFEAKLIVNPALKRDLHFQRKTYELVKMYHREQLKEALEALHLKIFDDPQKKDFQQSIYKIFK